MSDQHARRGLRERLTTQTEDALGKAAQELFENPLITGAIARVFEVRERASQAQEAAMGALNLPSAADIERLTRRLRSVSQRLEGIEDGVDRLDRALATTSGDGDVQVRLSTLEAQLATLTRMVADVREALPGTTAAVSLSQQRLAVESAAATPGKQPPKPRKTAPRAAAGARAAAARPGGSDARRRGANSR